MKNILPALTLLTVLSSPGYAQDTVQVKSGWNIIGSVKAGAVPDVLTTVPDSIIMTSFFGYDPGAGYESTDTLGKGLGYWVKVSADGVIIFYTAIPPGDCITNLVVYEGNLYHPVKIGNQCWLNENLNVGTMIMGPDAQTDNDTLEKYCWANHSYDCPVYGGLYRWDEAMQYSTTPRAQGICPPGWHIPTLEEFQTLRSTLNSNGNALKAMSEGTGAGAGTNTTGFSALLAGDIPNSAGYFSGFDLLTRYWSSTESGGATAYDFGLGNLNGSITIYGVAPKYYGYSVRCLGD